MPSFERGAVEYCQWLTRGAHSNFALGLKLLPAERREAMEVFYAFCRAVDDLVDHNSDSSVHASPPKTLADPSFVVAETGSARTDHINGKEAVRPEVLEGERPDQNRFVERELALWRQQITNSKQGFPSHPIAVALQPILARYEVPLDRPLAIINGVEMDLTRHRYKTFKELMFYCERVASAVGLVSVRIFGCQHPSAEDYALNLGIALQLTNILRDVKTDAERGRIYLPLDELQQFGISEEEILQCRYTDSFRRLMAFQCERAHSFFQQAAVFLKASGESRKLLPARIMGAVYLRLLQQIERADYDVFSRRIAVPRWRQAMIAFNQLVR